MRPDGEPGGLLRELVETVLLEQPVRAKARRLAAERDMGLSEWLRALLWREFERDRKARARAAAKGGAA